MRWIIHLEGGPRRVNHAAVVIGEKIYSFGGYCSGEDYRVPRPLDVHVLNTVSCRWTALPIPRPNEDQYYNVPFQRYGHTAVTYRGKAYLWGGRNDAGVCNKLYCFDPATHTWSRPQVNGRKPGSRDGHSACVTNDQMYIFGGYVEEEDRFSQDVHSLDFLTMTWSYILTKGDPPRWRDFHSATAIGQYMYIFGGRGDRLGQYHSPNNEEYCNQIHCLDTVSRLWTQPTTSGIPPIGRRSHSAFVYNDQLYIFGGYNGVHCLHFRDLFRYDPITCVWSMVKVSNPGPCARRRQCCCVIYDRVFLFGGTSPYSIEETYIENPSEAVYTPNDVADPALMDHNDLYVLDFAPTLKTLCEVIVIECGLDQSCLPAELRWEIAAMTVNNNISRPLNTAG